MPAHLNVARLRSLFRLRVGLIVVGSLVVLAGIAYGVVYALVGSGVLPNTTVSGITLGSLSTAAAQTKLANALHARATAPIAVSIDGHPYSVDPATAGLGVDVPATLARGGRRDASPVGLLRQLSARHELTPVLSVDPTKLKAAVSALNARIAGGGHDGGITFDGTTPVATLPVAGIALQQTQAAAAIKAAYFTSSGPVTLPVTTVQPTISAAAVQTALTAIAQPAVAAPISVVVGSTTLEVTPAVIAANLTFTPSAGALVPSVNIEGIVDSLGAGAFTSLDTPSKNASFDVGSGTPVLVPAVEGGTANIPALETAIQAVLTQPAPRMAVTPAQGVDPAFTTADAEQLGINEMVSTFTTHYPCCAARVTNIHTIANIVNGAVVMPGATFSLNQFVGMRDTKRGFVEAPMIEDGLFEDSVGGGVSQFATTLYNAVFFAGLKDIEHHPHSYYISRYPVGREATVSWPAPNLIFQNNTPTGIVITTSYTGTSLTVTFWGTKYYDVTSTTGPRTNITTTGTVYDPRPDCEAGAGEPGFQIQVTQTLSQDGVVVATNVLNTKYDPEPIIICGPSPSPGASGPPTGTPSPGTPTPSGGTPSTKPDASPSVSPTH